MPRAAKPVPASPFVHPAWAVAGARVTVHAPRAAAGGDRLPAVAVGGAPARVVTAASSRVTFIVPAGVQGGRLPVEVEGLDQPVTLHVASVIASGVHQVDNPAVAASGDVFLTNSGARGQRVPVSLYRVPPSGEREDYLSDLVNATSMAFDGDGALHVSSRYDGVVYRVGADRRVESVAGDLGVACGIAFAPDGTLFVGDRSGTVFRVGPGRRVAPFATLPASMAAFHLASGPGSALFVSAPTFGTYDHVYRIGLDGAVSVVSSEFGRPQGLAVDERGDLLVVDAVAGRAGLYRVRPGQPRECLLGAPALVGVALDPRGGLVVSSNDTAYRLDVPVKPFRSS